MIPFQYCLCERPGRELDDWNMKAKIGSAAARYMNLKLEEEKFDEVCEKLYLDLEWPMTKLIEYDTSWPRKEKRFFKLLFRVLPGNGIYEAFAKVCRFPVIKVCCIRPKTSPSSKTSPSCIRNFIEFRANMVYG